MATRESFIATSYPLGSIPRTATGSSSSDLFRRIISILEIATDFTACTMSIFFSYLAYVSLHIGKQVQYPLDEVAGVSVLVGLLSVLLMEGTSAYRGGGSLLQIRETERAIRIPVQLLLVTLPFIFALNLHLSRVAFCISLFVLPITLIVEKQAFFFFVDRLHARGYGIERAIIYGAGEAGRRITSTLLHSPRLGLLPVSVIDDNPALAGTLLSELGYWRNPSLHIEQGPPTAEMLKAHRSQLLIVAITHLPEQRLAALHEAAQETGMRVACIAAPALYELELVDYLDVDGLLLACAKCPTESLPYLILKRLIDLVGASLSLLCLAPLMLTIAIFIRLDSPGPVLFAQKRVGKNGRLFTMYKFRSMYTESPRYHVSPAVSSDPRLTRVGRLLRRLSLDELPQLINVIRGDMSLVGPRPEMPFVVQQYTEHQRQRLQVLPGITGLWQLSCDRVWSIHDNVQYDLYYIQHRTLFMDLAILIHTTFFAMRGV